MSDQPDEELVAAAKGGDHQAFNTLVSRHATIAYVVALAHSPDPDSAEDIAQEAFIRAWNTIQTCRHGDRFGSWVATIVRRGALSTWRTQERRRRIRAWFRSDIMMATRSVDSTPDHTLESEEFHGDLEKAVRALAPKEREVLMLYDLQGCAHDEISATLGITTATSRKYLSEARGKVRARLQHHMTEAQ